MGFQILDKNGNAMAINAIDKEICEFFGVEQHKKWYASPPIEDDSFKAKWNKINWFDYIGWMIHYDKIDSWDKMTDKMIEPFQELLIKEGYTEKQQQIEFLKTQLHSDKFYFELIEKFKNQGYIPKPVED